MLSTVHQTISLSLKFFLLATFHALNHFLYYGKVWEILHLCNLGLSSVLKQSISHGKHSKDILIALFEAK